MQVNRHGKTYTAPKHIPVFLPHCVHCHTCLRICVLSDEFMHWAGLPHAFSDSYMTTKLDCNLVPIDMCAGEKKQHVR